MAARADPQVRLVLDASSAVSGLISPGGAAAAIVRLVLTGAIQAFATEDIVAEYHLALSRPTVLKLMTRKARSGTDVQALLADLESRTRLVELKGEPPP